MPAYLPHREWPIFHNALSDSLVRYVIVNRERRGKDQPKNEVNFSPLTFNVLIECFQSLLLTTVTLVLIANFFSVNFFGQS